MSADVDARYVERYFWSIQELAEALGAPVDQTVSLIASRCAPGPIYILGECGWWSAVERHGRAAPPGVAWYSPGAAWGLRRALLAMRAGATEEEAAAMLEQTFADSFLGALGKVKGARLAFPKCFDGDEVDVPTARVAAREEWGAWLDGGYGVCLRVFTGWNCVAKEALGASIKTALALGDYDPTELLLEAETLSDLMLPFAPWQREAGTPGRTIDRLLNDQALGREHPYAHL